jgi:hypothetical protein
MWSVGHSLQWPHLLPTYLVMHGWCDTPSYHKVPPATHNSFHQKTQFLVALETTKNVSSGLLGPFIIQKKEHSRRWVA